jgi:hypothetical protein
MEKNEVTRWRYGEPAVIDTCLRGPTVATGSSSTSKQVSTTVHHFEKYVV